MKLKHRIALLLALAATLGGCATTGPDPVLLGAHYIVANQN